MTNEYPKLVSGTCTVCHQEGSDFQFNPTAIICGKCKANIGKKITGSYEEENNGIRNRNQTKTTTPTH
jgi:hypothetical protein